MPACTNVKLLTPRPIIQPTTKNTTSMPIVYTCF